MFTLVTPTFNRAAFLGKAMESVRIQARADVEHWVVDGGSTDDTAAVVARFPGTRFLSEPDHGIYDALNKGCARATGEIVGLLNSDDLLPSGTLDAVAAAFRDPAVEVVSGGAEIFRFSEGKEECVLLQNDPRKIALTPENVLFGVPAINARFFRRSILERYLPFDLRYRIAADRDLLLRMAVSRVWEKVLDKVLYRYCEHEGSLTVRKRVPLRQSAGWEHLSMIEHHSQTATRELRMLLRKAHTHESAWLFWKLLAAGEIPEALEMARRGFRTASAWPMRAMSLAGRAAAQRFRTR